MAKAYGRDNSSRTEGNFIFNLGPGHRKIANFFAKPAKIPVALWLDAHEGGVSARGQRLPDCAADLDVFQEAI
jgi:hypothetical protein